MMENAFNQTDTTIINVNEYCRREKLLYDFLGNLEEFDRDFYEFQHIYGKINQGLQKISVLASQCLTTAELMKNVVHKLKVKESKEIKKVSEEILQNFINRSKSRIKNIENSTNTVKHQFVKMVKIFKELNGYNATKAEKLIGNFYNKNAILEFKKFVQDILTQNITTLIRIVRKIRQPIDMDALNRLKPVFEKIEKCNRALEVSIVLLKKMKFL